MTKHMHREEKIRREAASKRASPAPKRKKHRKRKKGHPVLIALLIFVLLIGLCLGGAYYVLNTKLNKIERYEDVPQPTVPPEEQSFELEETDLANPGEDTRKAEEIVWQKPQETKKEPKVKNILLIGQDRRVGAAETRARSDSVIICSINEDTDKGDYVGQGTNYMRNAANHVVDGRLDLVNLFPVKLDLKPFIDAWGNAANWAESSRQGQVSARETDSNP